MRLFSLHLHNITSFLNPLIQELSLDHFRVVILEKPAMPYIYSENGLSHYMVFNSFKVNLFLSRQENPILHSIITSF